MITISYNRSIILLDSLKKIEQLKKIILLTSISPKVELRLRWETTLNRLYHSLSLANIQLPKRKIVKLLTAKSKRSPSKEEKKVLSLKKAHDYIYQNWQVTRSPISTNAVLTINEIICQGKFQPQKRNELQKILNFLTAGPENPIIQAAIIQAEIVNNTTFTSCNELTSILAAQLFHAKYGYNFRNMLVLEEYWSQDKTNYEKTLEVINQKGNLTTYLEYFTQALAVQLEKTVKKMKSQRFEIAVPTEFWRLNDRQKEISSLLQEPNSTITNRKVQKIFKISQITASRDLAKLTSLGLLLSHGKGRSIYYTRGYADL